MSFRVLVTGATGLLGNDLCQLLKHLGVECRGWSRHGNSAEERIDLSAPDAEDVIRRRIQDYQPALIIHTAAMSDVDWCELHPEEAFKNNAEAVRRIAQGCEAIHPKAVALVISTDYVFDGSLDRPYSEEDPANPLSVYGRSKLEGEKYALTMATRCLVVRVSGLFGSARSNFVTQAVERFRAGTPIPVVTGQKYSPSWTRDLAQELYRLILAIQKDPEATEKNGKLHGIFHLASSGEGTRLEVARLIGRFLGIASPDTLIQPTTWNDLQRPAKRPVNSQLECARWRELFGTCLRSWQEAVSDFLTAMDLDQKAIP